jgi:SAM-dependent methyltransferase
MSTYVGAELDLFARATHWKRYVAQCLRPYIGRSVLEVGAGFGGSTRWLCRGSHERWLCLEPDPALAERLDMSVAAGDLPSCCVAQIGALESIPDASVFESVLYLDVLEHIGADAAELMRAATYLSPGGYLVVLAPAHPLLYSDFDRAVGHHRRYTRRRLANLTPRELELVRLDYLDSVGLIASLGNRFLLRKRLPGALELAAWDKLMVPLSRLLDPLLGHTLGKSLLAIWRRPLHPSIPRPSLVACAT